MSITRTAFRPAEVARQWGMAPDTIIALIRSGRLPATNISLGKKKCRWLVTEDDIRRFHESNRVQPPPTRRRRRAKMIDSGETFGF